MQFLLIRVCAAFFLMGVMPWSLAHGQFSAGQTPCDYFTKADAEALFQRTVNDPILKAVSAPAGQSCRYTFSHAGDSGYGVAIRISTTSEIAREGIFSSVKERMDRQKKTLSERSDAFKDLAGLGEDAFWNGTDLWMSQADMLIIVTVHPVLEGSFPDMNAAHEAKSEQALTLSKQVALAILDRLP
ncbi:MAG TPA: hypothetical protein ENN39_06945 [Desulfonatronum sp.]|nr:hypothetical protein [Desulfonatronum sp.]